MHQSTPRHAVQTSTTLTVSFIVKFNSLLINVDADRIVTTTSLVAVGPVHVYNKQSSQGLVHVRNTSYNIIANVPRDNYYI